VSTFAGSTEGHLDGPATCAKFSYPVDIAVDSFNNLFVAEFLKCRIRKITPQGIINSLS
jgi:large repetitive protein